MSESVREGVGEDLESWIMYIDHTYCIEQLKQFAVFLLTHTQTTLKTTPLPFPPLPSSPFPSSPLLSPPQVSAWGGYVFIINLIPLHIFALLLMGRYSSRIYVGECRALCRLACMNTHQGGPSPYSPPLPCPSPLPLSCPSPSPSLYHLLHHGTAHVYAGALCRVPANQDLRTHGRCRCGCLATVTFAQLHQYCTTA